MGLEFARFRWTCSRRVGESLMFEGCWGPRVGELARYTSCCCVCSGFSGKVGKGIVSDVGGEGVLEARASRFEKLDMNERTVDAVGRLVGELFLGGGVRFEV